MPSSIPVWGAVALAGWAYARGTRRIEERTGSTHRWRAVAFVGGLAALLLVLVTPLDELAHERLWAHMLQHSVLVAVAAPLLVLANPLPAMLWALPPGARRGASPWWRRISRSHARPEGWVTWVLSALALHTVTLWTWHAPGPYQAALRSDWLHGVEHASFLGTALFFWWAVLGARRRSLYGPGVLAVFAAALQGTVLGAFMTLASRPWYPAYASGGAGGLTPMEDQQVAGVVMWGPSGAAYLLAAVLLFAAWLGGSDGPAVAPVRTGGRP